LELLSVMNSSSLYTNVWVKVMTGNDARSKSSLDGLISNLNTLTMLFMVILR